jgi:hypothetical protein
MKPQSELSLMFSVVCKAPDEMISDLREIVASIRWKTCVSNGPVVSSERSGVVESSKFELEIQELCNILVPLHIDFSIGLPCGRGALTVPVRTLHEIDFQFELLSQGLEFVLCISKSSSFLSSDIINAPFTLSVCGDVLVNGALRGSCRGSSWKHSCKFLFLSTGLFYVTVYVLSPSRQWVQSWSVKEITVGIQ